jgi:hypothetical protein
MEKAKHMLDPFFILSNVFLKQYGLGELFKKLNHHQLGKYSL